MSAINLLQIVPQVDTSSAVDIAADGDSPIGGFEEILKAELGEVDALEDVSGNNIIGDILPVDGGDDGLSSLDSSEIEGDIDIELADLDEHALPELSLLPQNTLPPEIIDVAEPVIEVASNLEGEASEIVDNIEVANNNSVAIDNVNLLSPSEDKEIDLIMRGLAGQVPSLAATAPVTAPVSTEASIVPAGSAPSLSSDSSVNMQSLDVLNEAATADTKGLVDKGGNIEVKSAHNNLASAATTAVNVSLPTPNPVSNPAPASANVNAESVDDGVVLENRIGGETGSQTGSNTGGEQQSGQQNNGQQNQSGLLQAFSAAGMGAKTVDAMPRDGLNFQANLAATSGSNIANTDISGNNLPNLPKSSNFSNSSNLPSAALDMVRVNLGQAAVNGQRQMTLQLRPLELGQVEVKLDFAEDGKIQAKILADRPETLGALRHDARSLETALAGTGFDKNNIDLSFDLRDQNRPDFNFDGENGAGAGTGHESDDVNNGGDENSATIDDMNSHLLEISPLGFSADGGLDIKI